MPKDCITELSFLNEERKRQREGTQFYMVPNVYVFAYLIYMCVYTYKHTKDIYAWVCVYKIIYYMHI